MIITLIKLFIRRIWPRRYDNIVAPLSHMADDLLALQEQNHADNKLDTKVIEKLNQNITDRDAENSRASASRSKILSLLAH